MSHKVRFGLIVQTSLSILQCIFFKSIFTVFVPNCFLKTKDLVNFSEIFWPTPTLHIFLNCHANYKLDLMTLGSLCKHQLTRFFCKILNGSSWDFFSVAKVIEKIQEYLWTQKGNLLNWCPGKKNPFENAETSWRKHVSEVW